MSTERRIFDPFRPGFAEDPWDDFTWFRENDPVHQIPSGPLLLFRYDDSQRMLRDRESSVELSNVRGSEGREMFQPADKSMVNVDPPKHDRLRGLFSKAFTPKRINDLEPEIELIVEGLLDGFEGRDSIEYVNEFARKVPSSVMASMLVLPPELRRDITDWAVRISRTIDSIKTPEEVADAKLALGEMADYLREVIAYKRKNPTDDLLAALLAAQTDEGDRLTEEEVVDQMQLIFVAGYETTVILLSNVLHVLMAHPEAMRAWRQDPSIGKNTIEEVLRWDPPFTMSGRRVNLVDMEFQGVPVPAYTEIVTCAASSNRDPRVFGEDADEFKPDRENANRHLSFGNGVHHCLGAALTRIEARVAVGRFIERYPNVGYASPPTRQQRRTFFRNLIDMPLTLDAG